MIKRVSKVKVVFTIITVSLLIWLSIYTPPSLNKTKFSIINLFKFPLYIAQSASCNLRDFLGRRLSTKWIKENMKLKNDLARLSCEIAELKEVEAENKRLKELLDFNPQTSKKSIPARVIGRDSSLLSRTILIDRGKADGIEVGMAVISTEGVVGRITEADLHISGVMLLGDPDLRLGVVIQRTREQGLFVGGTSGKAKVIYLAPNTDVKIGDVIVSFPTNRIFPKGLLIGYVKELKTEHTALYKFATVNIAVDYSRLEEVLCIK